MEIEIENNILVIAAENMDLTKRVEKLEKEKENREQEVERFLREKRGRNKQTKKRIGRVKNSGVGEYGGRRRSEKGKNK